MKRTRRIIPRGTVLVCVLACMGVVLSLIASSMLVALRSRAETRIERQCVQSEFLCDAGMLRAKQKLQNDPTYQGEIWTPILYESAADTAQVEIQIRLDADVTSQVIDVKARIVESNNVVRSVQTSHQFKIQRSEINNKEPSK